MQYSVEWANIVTGYLKKQLLEIALPMAPRPGLNIRQTFKGVLSDPDSRERWISKFLYSYVESINLMQNLPLTSKSYVGLNFCEYFMENIWLIMPLSCHG